MSTVTTTRSEVPARGSAAATNGKAEAAADRRLGIAAHQAFWVLRIAFTVAPILFGLDKFFNWSVDWPDYLAGWVNNIMPGSGQDFMYFVGGVEIFAGFLVLLAPRIGAFVVAAWLGGIVINLLTVDPPHLLRHRPAGLRPDAGSADTRPAGAGGRPGPKVRGSARQALVARLA